MIGCLTCRSNGLMGGPWPMKVDIYSRPSAVSLKVWLRETRRRLTQLYTKTCWSSIITTHVKVFINSTSGVNLGQDCMFVEQRPTGRVQETCLKTSEIIIFAILFGATNEKKTERKMHITVKLLCSKTSKQTEKIETNLGTIGSIF